MRRVLAAVILVGSMIACTRVLDIGDEGGNGPCGEGTCRPGVMCTKTCSSCFCNDKAEWYCSATCAEDAGTACPTTMPTEGASCSSAAPRCTYKNVCDKVDTALCVASTWQVFVGRCPPPPECPRDPPVLGSACDRALKCPYPNKCGVVFEAVCDGRSWFVEHPMPCPNEGCPLTAPTAGTPCFGDAKCTWTNACGTSDFGSCTKGFWTVNQTCAPAGCPSVMPNDGDACTSNGLACKWSDGCDGGSRDGTCQSNKWTVGGCH